MVTTPSLVNPLAFPAGVAPGFDPTHIAATGGAVNFSMIATPGGTLNILNGSRGTNTGTITNSIVSPIGPAIKIGTNSSWVAGSTTAAFPTGGSAVLGVVTLTPAVLNVFAVLVTNTNTSTTGLGLGYNNTGKLAFYSKGVLTFATSIQLAGNTAYFLAASVGNTATVNSTIYFYVLNLANGVVLTESDTLTTANKPTANASPVPLLGGSGGAGGSATNAFIAAGLTGSGYLTSPLLAQWGSDLWSAWYPQSTLLALP